MEINCPKCRRKIPAADVNVAKDVALCRACGQTFEYSELLDLSTAVNVDVNNPPRGAWFVDKGYEVRLGARHYKHSVWVLVIFTAFWSGAWMAGMYRSQDSEGKFDLHGLLPFLIITCIFTLISLLGLFGKTEVRMRGMEGQTFVGIGPVGLKKRFHFGSVKEIVRKPLASGDSDRSYYCLYLEMEDGRRIGFGGMLEEVLQRFVFDVLRKLLAERK